MDSPTRLLVAASGTGGHVFPALATVGELEGFAVEWLGVPDRLEAKLVPDRYPLHTISMGGFQGGSSNLKSLLKLSGAFLACRKLLKRGKFQGVFTTGGYIAAPAILAARSLALPTILHESNALPGKVTRMLGGWCDRVAIGFAAAEKYLPRAKTTWVGTPVRPEFLQPTPLELPVPEGAPLVAIMGGSQGAVSVNQLVRQCAPAWFEAGAWVVHLTGSNDPDAGGLQHPQYISMPFYENVAGLLQRADLAVSRAGAGSLTELAASRAPAILIPYPYAADNHQIVNAAGFVAAGAALCYRQADLTVELLRDRVLELLRDGEKRDRMATAAASLAVPDSAKKLAEAIAAVVLKAR